MNESILSRGDGDGDGYQVLKHDVSAFNHSNVGLRGIPGWTGERTKVEKT